MQQAADPAAPLPADAEQQLLALEAEREQLEHAIARAWDRVEAANAADPDPRVRALVERATAEVDELEAARDRRLRSLAAAADLEARRATGGGQRPPSPMRGFAGEPDDEGGIRWNTRFPVDASGPRT